MGARNYSVDEARDILNTYVTNRLIALEAESLPGRVNLDGFNAVTGQREAGNVGGVVIRYWGNSTKGTEGAIQPGAAPGHLDPRNALALVNLCQYLHANWGITELYHIGIDGSDPSVRNDCHGQGRAVDFSGVRGIHPVNGDEVYLTVWNDWGKVYVPGITTSNGDWPDGTGSNTDFRLDHEGAPDGYGRNFFRDLYNYIAIEWQDRTFGPEDGSNPTTIGRTSRVIMHPDHPATAPGTKNGREAHKSHIHFQIGPTGPA